MPPKRISDVFDDNTTAAVVVASGPAASTRDGKKRRQEEKQKVQEVSDTNAGVDDEFNSADGGEKVDDTGSVAPTAGGLQTPTSNSRGVPDAPRKTQSQGVELNGTATSPETSGCAEELSESPSTRLVIRGPSSAVGRAVGQGGVPSVDPAISEFRRLAWFPGNFDQRIRPMLSYQKPSDGVYSLSMLPERELAWGQSDTSGNKLCKRGSNVPVVVWIIGTVSSVWFYDQYGNPHNKVSVGVAPLTEHAMNKGRRLLSQFACPKQNIESWTTHLNASRWQTMRIPKRRDVAVIPFDRCFNATVKFENRSRMETLPVEDIKVNDVVVVEAQIGRYAVSTNTDTGTSSGQSRGGFGKDKNRQRSSPAEWKPTFDLVSLSLLVAAPDDPVDALTDDVPDIDVAF